MTEFITSRDGWLAEYRKDKSSIWVIAELSDGTEVYFKNHKRWLDLREKCYEEDLYIHAVRLQYRSHVVKSDLQDADAAYLVRSVMGEVGGPTKQYYTVGKLLDGTMHKSMWVIPELIEEEKVEETLDNCFEEAIIYNHARKTD